MQANTYSVEACFALNFGDNTVDRIIHDKGIVKDAKDFGQKSPATFSLFALADVYYDHPCHCRIGNTLCFTDIDSHPEGGSVHRHHSHLARLLRVRFKKLSMAKVIYLLIFLVYKAEQRLPDH